MTDGKSIYRSIRKFNVRTVASRETNDWQYATTDKTTFLVQPLGRPKLKTAAQKEKQSLQAGPDKAILSLVRSLARQAAREDHARESADKAQEYETSRDLRPVLDRSSG